MSQNCWREQNHEYSSGSNHTLYFLYRQGEKRTTASMKRCDGKQEPTWARVEDVFLELLSPGESSHLSPEIHRLIVLQMSDLNSWVLNQDWGKQQQKLVYRALLRSDGNLWGASRAQAIFWTFPHPEKSPWLQKGPVIKPSTWHRAAFLFTREAISICSCPTSRWTPYPTWGPLLKHHATLASKAPSPSSSACGLCLSPFYNLAKD